MDSKRGLYRKIVPVIIVVALCFSFVGQALAANFDVDISTCTDAADIQAAIQDKIDSAVSGDIVTVVGENHLGHTDGFELTIPEDITVIWRAELTGIINGTLIGLHGFGTFEMHAGSIESADTDFTIALESYSSMHSYYFASVDIVVYDGIIRSESASGSAIFTDTGNVTINGGTILSIGSSEVSTIYIQNGNATISGGSVIAEGQGAVAIRLEYVVTLDMTGGIVSAIGQGSVAIILGRVTSNYGLVRITGGSVSASGYESYAIIVFCHSGAAVYLKGTVIGDVLALTQYGVIIEASLWNITSEQVGTRDGLEIKAIGTRTDPDEYPNSQFDFYWESIDSQSVAIVLKNIGSDGFNFFSRDYTVSWGGWTTGEPAKPPTTPGTGDSSLYTVGFAMLVLLTGTATLISSRRRFDQVV